MIIKALSTVLLANLYKRYINEKYSNIRKRVSSFKITSCNSTLSINKYMRAKKELKFGNVNSTDNSTFYRSCSSIKPRKSTVDNPLFLENYFYTMILLALHFVYFFLKC